MEKELLQSILELGGKGLLLYLLGINILCFLSFYKTKAKNPRAQIAPVSDLYC